jgi:hypothetical protein
MEGKEERLEKYAGRTVSVVSIPFFGCWCMVEITTLFSFAIFVS